MFFGTIRITGNNVRNTCSCLKENVWFRNNTNIFKWRNRWYQKNNSFSQIWLVSGTIENKVWEQKEEFLDTLTAALSACLLGNMLAGKVAIQASEGGIRTGQDFWCRLILWLTLKYKNIIRINLNIMMFIQEVISLKQRIMGHI